jgi:hypothetical protein
VIQACKAGLTKPGAQPQESIASVCEGL